MEEYHSGPLSGHFSGNKLYKHYLTIGGGKVCIETSLITVLPVHSVLLLILQAESINHFSVLFHCLQIFGVDVVDLPTTEAGNWHVVIVQDLLTKFPQVFAVQD